MLTSFLCGLASAVKSKGTLADLSRSTKSVENWTQNKPLWVGSMEVGTRVPIKTIQSLHQTQAVSQVTQIHLQVVEVSLPERLSPDQRMSSIYRD